VQALQAAGAPRSNSSVSRPPVLLSGATGFLGRSLARLLVGQGYELHGLARERSDRSRLEDLPLRWHVGDLTDEGALERVLSELGSRAPQVIHSGAAISYHSDDGPLQEAVNVGGTRALLRCARRHGAGRFVFISSVVTLGAAPDAGSSLDEDASAGVAHMGDYARTKRAAEELALGAAASGQDVVVVNPGAIYGPHSWESNTTRFVQAIAGRELGPLAPPGSISVVGVEDVARGTLLALQRGRSGRRYVLTSENLTHRELMCQVAAQLGVRAPRGSLPAPLWSAVVLAVGARDRLRRCREATPQVLSLLGRHLRFDNARARVELGWTPEGFGQVLEETVAWMRSEGLLPSAFSE